MKSLVFLALLVLCAACAPRGLSFVMVDNVAISPQSQVYASGFRALGDNIRHVARWDGAQWMALGKGFATAGNTLVTDGAGQPNTPGGFMVSWDGADSMIIADRLGGKRRPSSISPSMGLAPSTFVIY